MQKGEILMLTSKNKMANPSPKNKSSLTYLKSALDYEPFIKSKLAI